MSRSVHSIVVPHPEPYSKSGPKPEREKATSRALRRGEAVFMPRAKAGGRYHSHFAREGLHVRQKAETRDGVRGVVLWIEELRPDIDG